MTWQDIYKKYDTELMKEFYFWWFKQNERLNKYYDDCDYRLITMEEFGFKLSDIKDIWGYLICFAETKGYAFQFDQLDANLVEGEVFQVVITENENDVGTYSEYYGKGQKVCKGTEQAMLWCADKFFEVEK
jgi:hypothetical protein